MTPSQKKETDNGEILISEPTNFRHVVDGKTANFFSTTSLTSDKKTTQQRPESPSRK